MPLYRPQNALAQWRTLTVIIPHVLIAAVGVDHTMSSGILAIARTMAKNFAGTVFDMSGGKCFVQNLVVEYPGTWTAAQLLTPGTPANGYVIRSADVDAPLLSVGINAQMFDTVICVTHNTPFNASVGGIADYDTTLNRATAHPILFDSMTDVPPVLTVHEWLHGVCYFYFLRGGAPAYIDLDTPSNYRYLDNSAIPNPDGFYRNFMAGVMTGNVEDIATGTAQEITDTHWSYGTPRKQFP